MLGLSEHGTLATLSVKSPPLRFYPLVLTTSLLAPEPWEFPGPHPLPVVLLTVSTRPGDPGLLPHASQTNSPPSVHPAKLPCLLPAPHSHRLLTAHTTPNPSEPTHNSLLLPPLLLPSPSQPGLLSLLFARLLQTLLLTQGHWQGHSKKGKVS